VDFGIYIHPFIPGYLLVGLFFCFLYDKLIDSLPEIEENRFNWGERVAITIFWPIGLFVFVYHFLSAFFGNDE